jgi:hypothetical protein
VRVQALLSLQGVPLALGVPEQTPVAGLQVPPFVHCSAPLQITAAPGRHPPSWQVSGPVHRLLSALQGLPLLLAGFEHTPVIGLQLPGSWHWSGAGQVVAGPA